MQPSNLPEGAPGQPSPHATTDSGRVAQTPHPTSNLSAQITTPVSLQPTAQPNTRHQGRAGLIENVLSNAAVARLNRALTKARTESNSIEQLLKSTAYLTGRKYDLVASWNLLPAPASSQLPSDQSQNQDPTTGDQPSAPTTQLELTPKCLVDPVGDLAAWRTIGQRVKTQIQQALSSFAAESETGEQATFLSPIVNSLGREVYLLAPLDAHDPATSWLGAVFHAKLSQEVIVDCQMISNHLQLGINELRHKKTLLQGKGLIELVALSNHVASSDSEQSALMIVANRLRQLTNSLQVIVATRKQNQDRFVVRAISDVDTFDAQSENMKMIVQAASVAGQGEPIKAWHSNSESDDMELVALKNYAHFQDCDGVINSAFGTDEQPQATVLIAASQKQITNESYMAYVQSICHHLGNQLDLLRAAKRTPARLFRDWVKEQKQRRWTRLMLAGVGLFLLAMAIPLPYQINCDCEIGPVERRFVSAPYDGVLEKSEVQNGDVVESGQIMGRMEGRLLRMEMSSLRAEKQGQIKTRDAARARGNIAESQIAAEEIERLDAEISLIQSRLDNLEIRSPIDGVVISGDLEDAEGATMEIGQQLFEIGPLNRMLVEIRVPDNEIKFVAKEMPVRVRLNAFPFKTWQGKISKIHTRSELIDDNNVFVVEIEVENLESRLRPGMIGKARITSNARPLGWNLFHHSFDSLRRWLIW